VPVAFKSCGYGTFSAINQDMKTGIYATVKIVFITVQGAPWCLTRAMSFYCLLIILHATSCFVVIFFFSFLFSPSFRLTPAMVNNLGKVKAL